jgi:pimeloyl-ACP methyl ester carboxylesterase
VAELQKIDCRPGLIFETLVDGAVGAPLVLLLHGFAESFHMWSSQLFALATAGYRAVAPSQRGYSPGARPDVTDLAQYHFDRLVADAMGIVAACGYGDRRFHLVGHDWGASIAWGIADRYRDRLASLTVLSRPHPTAEWIANQITQACSWEQAPRYLIRDWDKASSEIFIRRLRSMGIRDRPTSPRSPWQNGYAERLIGSIRRECVDHIIVLGERHLRHVLLSYMKYYNEVPTHLSLEKDAPVPRAIGTVGHILCRPVLGGLRHQYVRI